MEETTYVKKASSGIYIFNATNNLFSPCPLTGTGVQNNCLLVYIVYIAKQGCFYLPPPPLPSRVIQAMSFGE
jgi:hypothetical protein